MDLKLVIFVSGKNVNNDIRHGSLRSRKVPSTEYNNVKNESKSDSQDGEDADMMYEWVVEDDNMTDDHSRLVETTLEEPSPSSEQGATQSRRKIVRNYILALCILLTINYFHRSMRIVTRIRRRLRKGGAPRP
jgi:hypothetical protein